MLKISTDEWRCYDNDDDTKTIMQHTSPLTIVFSDGGAVREKDRDSPLGLLVLRRGKTKGTFPRMPSAKNARHCRFLSNNFTGKLVEKSGIEIIQAMICSF